VEKNMTEESLMLLSRQLELKNRIDRIIFTVGDEEMYADVLDVVLEEMDSRFGFFGFLDEGENLVVPSMTRAVFERCRMPEKRVVFPKDSWAGLWGRSLLEKKSLLTNHGLIVPEGHIELSCALAVPILHREVLIGQIVVADKLSGYTEVDLLTLEDIVMHVAPLLHARIDRDRLDLLRLKAQRELEDKEKYYRSLLFNMHDQVLVVDRNYRITDFNNSVQNAVELNPEEIIDRNCFEFSHNYHIPCSHKGSDCPLEKVFATGLPSSCVHRHSQKNGKTVHVDVVLSPLKDETGRVTHVVESMRDITQLVTMLDEKRILLGEIHHRVKNNLAIVSSLLNLQAHAFNNQPAVAEAFSQCRRRIQSMALVHEQLYRSHDLAKIDFPDYIRELVRRLAQASRLQDQNITVCVNAEPISLGIDASIPLGLIITELVTNAFKHAFSQKTDGEIMVRMNKTDNAVQLSVTDNGAGLPEGFDLKNPVSFGLELVNLLTEQLNGKIEVLQTPQTTFTITFEDQLKD